MPSSLALAKQLTVEQHQGLLERQRVPDLHLAVGALKHASGEELVDGSRRVHSKQMLVSGRAVSSNGE